MVEFVATMPSRPLGARFVVTLDMLSLAQFEGFAFLTARGDTRRTQPFVIPQIARKFQAERRAGSDSATRGCEVGNPSVVMDLDVEEKAREIRLRFCEAITGKEAYRYAPERLGRSGGGTKPRGRAKAVTRDQGERLGEAISCRNSAVIRRAQRTWLVSLRAVALRLSAKKAWKRL